MYKEEIKNKLKELREERKGIQEEYIETMHQIDCLLDQLDCLESKQYRLEKKESLLVKNIQNLEKQLINKEFKELDNILTGEKFRDAFIKCSWFCRRYGNDKDPLSYVRVEKEKMVATDGYRGIIVECDNIPENLKSTFIKWDIRDNFKDNSRIEDWKVYDLQEVINYGKRGQVLQINAENFEKQLCYKSKTTKDKEIVMLKFNDKKVAFNKEYLDIALMAAKDMELKMYYPDNKCDPLVIESDNQNIVLLPISLDDDQY